MTTTRSSMRPRTAPAQAAEPAVGGMRFYATVGELVADLGDLAGRLPEVWAVWGGRSLDPAFREALMVAVAAANRCRYCSFMHHRWARALGVGTGRLARIRSGLAVVGASAEDTALAWVRARAAADFADAPPDLEAEMQLAFGAPERRQIETVARAMNLGNRAANTFEALRHRLGGRPVAGSRVATELLVGGGTAAVMPGAVVLLMLIERRSPLDIIDAFRRFSERLQTEWGPPRRIAAAEAPETGAR